MATATHDLVVKNGEYQDRESGETKARWLNVGTLFTHDDGGVSIKLDCFPVGVPEWQGWIKAYPKKPREDRSGGYQAPAQNRGYGQPQAAPRAQQARQPAPPAYPPADDGFGDEIPF